MAESGIITAFKITIIVMLFYSFAVSLLIEFLPTDSLAYVTSFSEGTTTLSEFDEISEEVQDQLTSQTNIPVLDVGSLVFYSGNILLNLLLNFIYAIPQMIGFLIHGLTLLFNLNYLIVWYIEAFAFVTMNILYAISLIQLLTGIRSGRII